MNPTSPNNPRQRVRIRVQGRVQGVGFRPTIYRAMTSRGCGGTIKNTPGGVEIEVEGNPETIHGIIENFSDLIPKRARIDDLTVDEELSPEGTSDFSIISSSSSGDSLLPIPPDLATCTDCKGELNNERDRRAGYPFNTCTCCGPRFTIARDVPFDRPTSAMDDFPLCEACQKEYNDPSDRRFHAQTMSCPDCGPSLTFTPVPSDDTTHPHPIADTRRMLVSGGIVAIKGLGGFHLACDATNASAVARIRKRKNRPHKPLAIMAADLSRCEDIGQINDGEKKLLTSPPSPIVLVRKRPDGPVVDLVAPGLQKIGIMLPYTPLHAQLFRSPDMPPALVMTSCNRSDEPIATSVDTVHDDLMDIVDGILWHNRPVENRCDDSLVASVNGTPLPMRRSRGYVPEPIILDMAGPSVFATGAMWKNTFAVTKGRRAFLSQHIGNVSDADNARHFQNTYERFSDLLNVSPETVVCDLHPDYPTTRFARELSEREGLNLMQVQHHHAHLASCLAEGEGTGPAIGVSMDGTGYGDDGCMWGGEFMVFDERDYQRRLHLEYVPMPGGDQAVLEPHRMALSHMKNAFADSEASRHMERYLDPATIDALANILNDSDLSPRTSSCGRLFDAVAALIGFGPEATYQGQAACELEAMCKPGEYGTYNYEMGKETIELGGIIRGVWEDLQKSVHPGIIATKFHHTTSDIILAGCGRLCEQTGIHTVALSGGVMQNTHLLDRLIPALQSRGLTVLSHSRVPPNDGGIALGQASIALSRLRPDDKHSKIG